MRTGIVSIGAELLTGAVVDTNSVWLSQRLMQAGVVVSRHTTVGDDRSAIAGAIRQAAEDADVVLATGGLGPTLDDLSREALADVTGQPLELDAASLAGIEAFFAAIGRSVSPSNRRQAMFPRGSTPLANDWGTAPGIRVAVGQAVVFVLPGVPREMRAMFEHRVEPELKGRINGSAIATRTLRCFGTGESVMAEKIADLMEPGRNPAVGTTASEGVITVRIVGRGDSDDQARALVDRDATEVRQRLGRLVFGEEADMLATAVGRELADRALTISTAESCTGGLVGKLLTDVPGSSVYYLGGIIAYSNRAKIDTLGVPADVIDTHGAVSEQVASAMADGCRNRIGTDFAISVTGVAGPTGGTPDKPVGLVFIGLAGPEGCRAKRCVFSQHLDRQAIRDRSAKTALNLLRHDLIRSSGRGG